MNLKVARGRIVVKKREVKLKGLIELPQTRARLYEIGEVVTVGDCTQYGYQNRSHTEEVYQPGELVLFQLPQHLAASVSYNIKGTLHAFLSVEDLIARLFSDIISLKDFKVVGRFVLLRPSVRSASPIVLPDSATEAKQENLHFSVEQTGLDVETDYFHGQEVFPDKGRVNPMVIDGEELAFVDQQFLYGALGGS
jgi:co-chaperonin GroES (HSP10)